VKCDKGAGAEGKALMSLSRPDGANHFSPGQRPGNK